MSRSRVPLSRSGGSLLTPIGIRWGYLLTRTIRQEISIGCRWERNCARRLRGGRSERRGSFGPVVQRFACVRPLTFRPPDRLLLQRKPAADGEFAVAQDLRLDAVFAVVAQLGAPGYAVLANRPEQLAGARLAARRGLVGPEE